MRAFEGGWLYHPEFNHVPIIFNLNKYSSNSLSADEFKKSLHWDDLSEAERQKIKQELAAEIQKKIIQKMRVSK
jgi:hypothetical protein